MGNFFSLYTFFMLTIPIVLGYFSIPLGIITFLISVVTLSIKTFIEIKIPLHKLEIYRENKVG